MSATFTVNPSASLVHAHGRVMSISAMLQSWTGIISLVLGGAT